MDTALQELGPSAELADRPVRGEAHSVSVKGKAGTSHFIKNVPVTPYSIGINSIARIIHPYSGGRVWAAPTESIFAANA